MKKTSEFIYDNIFYMQSKLIVAAVVVFFFFNTICESVIIHPLDLYSSLQLPSLFHLLC